MWSFSLKLPKTASVTPDFEGHQGSFTIRMGISKFYKGSPFPILLFAPTDFDFVEITFLPLVPYGLPVVIPAPSCSTIK